MIRHTVTFLCSLSLCGALVLGCGDGGTGDDGQAAALAAARGLAQSWVAEPLAALADDAMEGRDNLTPGGKRAREYLKARMAAIGLQPAGKNGGFEQPFDKGVNLVGKIPGGDPALAHQAVILSAHYDHLGLAGVAGSQCTRAVPGGSTAKNAKVCNGAADNASGCAAVLAVARALVAGGVPLGRTLLVIFWDAEEDGLLGSRHWTTGGTLWPLDKTAAMFSVDSLAAPMLPGLTPFFALGLEHSLGMRQPIYDADAALGGQTYPVSSFFAGGAGRSDHYPFQQQAVPVIFFSSSVPPEYHTPADELALVSPPLLRVFAAKILLVTHRLAAGATPPSFSSKARPHIDDARALWSLGSAVAKDPAAHGLDPSLAPVLQPLLDKLEEYIDTPPQTDQQWADYQDFIQTVLKLVFSVAGR